MPMSAATIRMITIIICTMLKLRLSRPTNSAAMGAAANINTRKIKAMWIPKLETILSKLTDNAGASVCFMSNPV